MRLAVSLSVLLLLAGCVARDGVRDAPPSVVPGAQETAWVARADAPRVLAETAVASEGDRMYVVGGWTEAGGGSPFAFVYDAGADTWSQLPAFPLPIHHAQAAAIDGTLYVFGGAVSQALMPGTFTGVGPTGWPLTSLSFKLPPGAQAWQRIADLPIERGLGGAAVVDGRIYLVGGTWASGYHTRVDVYDPAADRYLSAAPLPTPRDHLSVVAHEGNVYALAGRINEGAGWDDLESAEVLHVTADAWTPLPPVPLGRGGQGAGVIQGERIALVGGERAEGTFTVYDAAHAYDTTTGTWSELPPLPAARHGMAAASVQGNFVLAGGGLLDGTIERSTLVLMGPSQEG